MRWLLELAYPSAGALRVEVDTQLGLGGLSLDAAAPPAFPETGAVTLRLHAPDVEPIELSAEVGERSERSLCLEIDDDASRALRERAAAWAPAPAALPEVRFIAPVEAVPRELEPEASLARKIAAMSIGEKIQLALHGAREGRTLLARDRAGVVQAALIRNPRSTIEELCALARGPALAPDAAEALLHHPTFGGSPQIVLALVRNPRTPLPIATQLVARLQPGDLRSIAKGLGVRGQVAAAARKKLLG